MQPLKLSVANSQVLLNVIVFCIQRAGQPKKLSVTNRQVLIYDVMILLIFILILLLLSVMIIVIIINISIDSISTIICHHHRFLLIIIESLRGSPGQGSPGKALCIQFALSFALSFALTLHCANIDFALTLH